MMAGVPCNSNNLYSPKGFGELQRNKQSFQEWKGKGRIQVNNTGLGHFFLGQITPSSII